MMKVLACVLCAAVFLPVCTQGASSGVGGWFFVMPGGPRGGAAAVVEAADSFDTEDVLASPHGGWVAGTYRVNGIDGWNADTGFYSYDIRAPLSPGESKSWTVYFWATSDASPTDRGMQWGEWFSFGADPLVIPRLEYIQKPTGSVGGPDVGAVWTEPWMFLTLPFYSSSDGLTGHAFKFTLTMIPEPASLVALGIGLVGLVLRRRSRAY